MTTQHQAPLAGAVPGQRVEGPCTVSPTAVSAPSNWIEAFVSCGSNLGDRSAHLSGALAALTAHHGIRVTATSSVYRTAPVDHLDQPDFLNAVIRLTTVLPPLTLLRVLQHIETRHGRQRRTRWGPRTLDLDLLLHGRTRCDTGELILPHPRMTRRAFVLVPLCELAPDLRHPGTGLTMRQHLQQLSPLQVVQRIGPLGAAPPEPGESS